MRAPCVQNKRQLRQYNQMCLACMPAPLPSWHHCPTSIATKYLTPKGVCDARRHNACHGLRQQCNMEIRQSGISIKLALVCRQRCGWHHHTALFFLFVFRIATIVQQWGTCRLGTTCICGIGNVHPHIVLRHGLYTSTLNCFVFSDWGKQTGWGNECQLWSRYLRPRLSCGVGTCVHPLGPIAVETFLGNVTTAMPLTPGPIWQSGTIQ